MDWVKQLSEVTADDLAAVEVRLDALNNEMTALRALEAVFRAKLGVKPGPAPGPPRIANMHTPRPEPAQAVRPKRTSDGAVCQAHRVEAAKYLMRNGPEKPAVVCRECGIPDGSATAVFAHEWFARTDRGIELTQDGKKAATAAA